MDSPNLGLVAHQFTCPSGLYFNPAADSCDFARNVLCKKSQQATSTTTTTTTTERPTTTTKSNKITAATSKNTYYRPSTTTTTTTEEPYEEYIDQVDTNSRDAEEDPRVIKELIDLIKKVGGIEELEKQLLQNDDGSMVFKNKNEKDEKTTASPISKTLYDRVLSRPKSLSAIQNRFKSSSLFRTTTTQKPKAEEEYEDEEDDEVVVKSKSQDKYSSVIRNRGPQNEGIEQLAETEGFLREKPKYVTISRSHHKDIAEEEDNEKEETAEVVTKSSRLSDIEKPVTHAYTSIRRNRPSTERTLDEDSENTFEDEEVVADKRPYKSINRNRGNVEVTEAPIESSTNGRR